MEITTRHVPVEFELEEKTKSKLKNSASSIFKISKTPLDGNYSPLHWQIQMPISQKDVLSFVSSGTIINDDVNNKGFIKNTIWNFIPRIFIFFMSILFGWVIFWKKTAK